MSTDALVTPSSFVRRREEPIQAALNDDLILMSVAVGRYFDLDSIAADIWGRIGGCVRVSDVIADLVAKYDGDAAQIQDDVLEFLTFLATNGLIETGPPAAP